MKKWVTFWAIRKDHSHHFAPYEFMMCSLRTHALHNYYSLIWLSRFLNFNLYIIDLYINL